MQSFAAVFVDCNVDSLLQQLCLGVYRICSLCLEKALLPCGVSSDRAKGVLVKV